MVAIASAATPRPSGAIAAACARPPNIAPASASTRAAINDAITFFIGFFPVGLQEPTQPSNTNVDCKFQMAGHIAHKVGFPTCMCAATAAASSISELGQ